MSGPGFASAEGDPPAGFNPSERLIIDSQTPVVKVFAWLNGLKYSGFWAIVRYAYERM
jgi:hypothetical protein